MRKTLSQTLCAAFCAILLVAPLEGGGVMLIGARNAMLVNGGWKNPYVTDGLVAMWDGEWNAGPGVHDPNATVWRDLSGNGYDLTYQTGCQIQDDVVLNTNTGAIAKVRRTDTDLSSRLIALPVFTFEICEDATTSQDFYVWESGYFAFASSSNNDYAIYIQKNYSRLLCRNIFGIGAVNSFFNVHTLSGVIDSTANATYYINKASGQSTTVLASSPQSDATAGTTTFGITNKVHNIRLYSRALTASEIAANYAVDKARFNLP